MGQRLWELISDAIVQIDTYKHPNIDEAKKALDDILVASDLGSCARDHITRIEARSGGVVVEVEWYSRGCRQEDSYFIPSIIIDAVDPVYEATVWGLSRKISTACNDLEKANRYVVMAEADIAKHTQALETFRANTKPRETEDD